MPRLSAGGARRLSAAEAGDPHRRHRRRRAGDVRAGAPVHAVFAHMRCHYAYARARAFEEVVAARSTSAASTSGGRADPLAIEITHADGRQVDELRVHARQEAVYAGGSGP